MDRLFHWASSACYLQVLFSFFWFYRVSLQSCKEVSFEIFFVALFCLMQFLIIINLIYSCLQGKLHLTVSGPVSINQAGRLIRTLISSDIITKGLIKKETKKRERHFKNIDNYRPTALTVLSAHGSLSIYRYHRLTPSDLQTQIRVSRPIPGPPGCLSRALDLNSYDPIYLFSPSSYILRPPPPWQLSFSTERSLTLLHLLTHSLSRSIDPSFQLQFSFLSERSRRLDLANNIPISNPSIQFLFNRNFPPSDRVTVLASLFRSLPLPPASETITISLSPPTLQLNGHTSRERVSGGFRMH